MHYLIFGPALFYDIPEYLSIVATHTFWQSIMLGHFPIHPVFMALLWVLIRVLPVNAIAFVFGIASIFMLSRISKKAAVVYALFPVIWIINTNLMVESVVLFFYVLAIWSLINKKKTWFLISIFLMVGTHLESIVWVPTVFLIPVILGKKDKISGFVRLAIVSIFASIVFYLYLYKISGVGFAGSTEQLTTYLSSGLLRMTRNVWLSVTAGFGSLTILVLGFLILKNRIAKKEIVSWLIFGLLTTIIAANWQGDFMARRIAFAGVFLALALVKYLKRWWWIFAIYLLPIIVANIVLYAGGSPFKPYDLPHSQVLIQTHYLKPFTKYDGTILWIGESDLGKIDIFLASGKRVFLARDAVTAPYRLLVGNNYHITSLGRIGDSESRFLFKKYQMISYDGALELKLYRGLVSRNAGDPVVFYASGAGSDQSFWGRLSRRRIDYADIGTWVWAIVTNHRDPSGWTYVDVAGNWAYPK